jgi:hypothetical protein
MQALSPGTWHPENKQFRLLELLPADPFFTMPKEVDPLRHTRERKASSTLFQAYGALSVLIRMATTLISIESRSTASAEAWRNIRTA